MFLRFFTTFFKRIYNIVDFGPKIKTDMRI